MALVKHCKNGSLGGGKKEKSYKGKSIKLVVSYKRETNESSHIYKLFLNEIKSWK